MTDVKPPAVRTTPAGGGEQLRAPTGSYVIHLSGEQTGGALAVVEYSFPPGAVGAAPHVHRAHAEHFHILEGEVTFDLGSAETVAIAAGEPLGPEGLAALRAGYATDTL